MGNKRLISIIIAIILSLIFVIPSNGADEIASGLDATVVGVAEYSPGDDGIFQICVQNNIKLGELHYSAIQSGLSTYWGAAVSVTAKLAKEFAPIDIKTEEALIGTLHSGAATPPVPFNIKVNDDAREGEYKITLTLSYRNLKSTDSDDDDKEFKSEWTDLTEQKVLKIKIKAEKTVKEQSLDFKITRVDAEKFHPEDTGTIQIRVQNNKTIDKIDSTAMQSNLSQNYGAASGLIAHVDKRNAPLTIKTSDLLLGTLPAGQATPALPIFLEVDENATPGTYRINVAITYRTLKSTSLEDGDPQMEWSSGSANQDIDIEIKKKDKDLEFEVVSVDSELISGVKNQIRVTFRNKGAEEARDATVKLSAASPLSMTDNTVFLGTLQAGESSGGTFGIKVMADALQKEYTLDASVQYINKDGDKVSSDVIKVPVTVGAPESKLTFVNQLKDQWKMAAGGAGLIVIIWIAIGLVRVARRKN